MSQKELQHEEHWKLLVLILKEIADSKGITQAQIAERTGFTQSNISRMFSLKYSPSLKNFIELAQAIEVNFFFEDREDKTDLSVSFEKAMQALGRRNDKLRNN